MPPAQETEVAIVGGGTTGLSCAIELGLRGIECVLLESREAESADDILNFRTVGSPRAKLTNMRTMEHLRRWGLASRVRSVSPLPDDFPIDIAFVTRLDGYEIHRFHDAFIGLNGDRHLSPELPLQLPQPFLEVILREFATSLPNVRVRFNQRAETASQNEDGVFVVATDTANGKQQELRAKYLIGCDGAKSTIRQSLGVSMKGRHGLTRNINVVFRAPSLWSHVKHAPAVHYWTVNPDWPGLMGPLNSNDLWWAIFPHLSSEAAADSFDPLKAISTLATGIALDEVNVIDVTFWEAHELIADSYRKGRIFIAGDAAHLHPPAGGHGMNMGISDAVDLGWKLAACLEGWGGEALLDSYEVERRQIHRRVIESAVRNWSLPGDHAVRQSLEKAGVQGDAVRARLGKEISVSKASEFFSAGLVLGAAYEDSPIIVGDGTAPLPHQVESYEPNARPGSRAPHYQLVDGRALFDLFGTGFTLLRLGPAAVDCSTLTSAAETRKIPLAVITVADAGLFNLYGARLVLVRPDQHVAWRGDEIPADPARLLDTMRGSLAA